MGEEWVADAYVGGDCATEIARQQNRAKHSGARNRVQNGTGEQDNPEGKNDTLGIPQRGSSLYDLRRLYQFPHSIRKQGQCRQCADDASGQKTFLRNGSSLSTGLHELFLQRFFDTKSVDGRYRLLWEW